MFVTRNVYHGRGITSYIKIRMLCGGGVNFGRLYILTMITYVYFRIYIIVFIYSFKIMENSIVYFKLSKSM